MYKKKEPLVSVVMNCHNGSKFLSRSVKSIINQSYRNWELIFWDNKSIDNSKNIINSFKDRRIKYYYSSTFQKLYEARNSALRKCKGEFISFLDVDDYWLKNKLRKQIIFLQNKKIKVCFSNLYVFEKKTKTRLIYNKDSYYKTTTNNIISDYKLGLLTALIHKSFFKKRKFKRYYDIIGDFEYFIDLSQKTQIGYIKYPLAVYVRHNSNLSKKKHIYLRELLIWLKLNKKKFNKTNIKLYSVYYLISKLIVWKIFRFFKII